MGSGPIHGPQPESGTGSADGRLCDASVAQWIEQPPSKRQVASSILAGGASTLDPESQDPVPELPRAGKHSEVAERLVQVTGFEHAPILPHADEQALIRQVVLPA